MNNARKSTWIIGFLGFLLYYAFVQLALVFIFPNGSMFGNLLLDVLIGVFSFLIYTYVLRVRKEEHYQPNYSFYLRYAGAIILSILLINIASTSYYNIYGDPMYDIYVEDNSNYDMLTFLIIVILAPISEELFFRGILYESLNKAQIPFWVNVSIISLIFGLFHGTIMK